MSKIVPSTFTPHTSVGTAPAREHPNGEWRYPIGIFSDPRLLDPILRKLQVKMRDAEIEHRRAHPDVPLATEFG
jgi:hypothetical protein